MSKESFKEADLVQVESQVLGRNLADATNPLFGATRAAEEHYNDDDGRNSPPPPPKTESPEERASRLRNEELDAETRKRKGSQRLFLNPTGPSGLLGGNVATKYLLGV